MAGVDTKPTATRTVEKVVEREIGVYVATEDKAQVTLTDVYISAEKYLSAHSTPAEEKKWLEIWTARAREAGDEQVLANTVLIEKRGAFDVEHAKASDVADICRLMLRYRDAKLAIPSAFKEHVNAAALLKIKRFLEQ